MYTTIKCSRFKREQKVNISIQWTISPDEFYFIHLTGTKPGGIKFNA